MILEKDIERIASVLEESNFEKELGSFQKNQPMLYSYLLDDQFELLNEDEYLIFWFASMVIVKSFEAKGSIAPISDTLLFEEIESANWALLENSKPLAFNNKIDVFFEKTNHEDLLAFVEDRLADDDEMQVGSAAREIIFISLVSIIDLLDSVTSKAQKH